MIKSLLAGAAALALLASAGLASAATSATSVAASAAGSTTSSVTIGSGVHFGASTAQNSSSANAVAFHLPVVLSATAANGASNGSSAQITGGFGFGGSTASAGQVGVGIGIAHAH